MAGSGLARDSTRVWRRFLVWEALLALVYFPFGVPSGSPKIIGFIPWMQWSGQVPAWAFIGVSAVVAIFYGTHKYRPAAPVAWWFLGAGVLLFITSETIHKAWHQIIGRQNMPFPSFVDAIHIAMYPVLATGLLLLARARGKGRDRTPLLDSIIITLGVGLLFWIFLIGPNVRAHGDLLGRLTTAGYPLGDVLVLAMLTHLWNSGGLKNTAGRLLAIGMCATLVSDAVYGLVKLHPGWHWSDGNPLDLGWILFFACFGAAALHPSMRELSAQKSVGPSRTTRARLNLLAAVSLIAPAVLLVEAIFSRLVDAPVIAVAAALMFLLVLLRMSGLMSVHQQAVAREQALRRAAAGLAAAPDRRAIHRATIAAMRELDGGGSHVDEVLVALSAPSGVFEFRESTGVRLTGDLANLARLPVGVATLLEAGQVVRCKFPDRSDEDEGPNKLVYYPLRHDEQTKGLILVASGEDLPVELEETIEALVDQVEMALDRDVMTEALHVRRSEARFQTLVQNASDVILIARPDTTITYQTPSATTILGYVPGELEGVRMTTLLHEDDVEQAVAAYSSIAFGGSSTGAQWRIKHSDGSWRHVEVTADNLLGDPTVEGIVLTLRDVSERKGLEEELKHQAFHDALSGLANRALFRDRLEHALSRAARSRTSLAVLFIDLDEFKLVNDSLGHAAGDELLVAVGNRLLRSLRAGDTAARFGGDEFAILLEETDGPEDACQVAERVIADLKVPLILRDREVQAQGSIGIAYSEFGADDPAEILQAADVAMYAAKTRGKGCYEVYKPALQAAMVQKLEHTAELQRAVDLGQFVLHYQPIVNLNGGGEVGVEALVRWEHPERGMLPPLDFISTAEETGLIIPLGRWVLNEACRQARVWQDHHDLAGRLRMSVNISARQFQHDGLVEDVSRALRDAHLDPTSLVLEITESVLVQEVDEVVVRMLELKSLGVSFAIDDFGTGYSSLSYLRRFPIDILKVDKSFIDGLGDSAEDGALAEAIVQLGKTLNMKTVAEGIEQERQVDGLRALGCHYGQGYFFAKPLEADQVGEFLDRMAAAVGVPVGDVELAK